MITIYHPNGTTAASVLPSDSSVYSATLMQEEKVVLYYNTAAPLPLPKGSYIETDFGRFVVVYPAKPKRTAQGGYQYEQEFHAPWERLKERICFYSRQSGSEKAWSMTAPIGNFLRVIEDNASAAGMGEYTAVAEADISQDARAIQFDGTSVFDALGKIAQAWETEWWIDGTTIRFGNCQLGTEVSLSVDGGTLSSLDGGDNSKNPADRVTRLYAFGSTRNLTSNYRKGDGAGVVIEGVREARLKLPADTPYIDIRPNLTQEEIVEGVAIFDDIYPKEEPRTITAVLHKEYYDKVTDDNGEEADVSWTAYQICDGNAAKYYARYNHPTDKLKVTFQSGHLAGMTFDVAFNPMGLQDEDDPFAQYFEIQRDSSTYGTPLPSDALCPAVGDTFILHGYDISRVSDTLIPAAELELKAAAEAKVAQMQQDASTYTAKTNKIRCAGFTTNAAGQHTHSTAAEISLAIGQAVCLTDTAIMGGRAYHSRVRAFEKKLHNPFDATYTIGTNAEYSRTAELQKKVEAISYRAAPVYTAGADGGSVYLIKTNDSTTPSEWNAYSAARANATFIRKDQNDRTDHLLAMAGGAQFGEFVSGLYTGSGAAIDERGNAEVQSLRVRSYIEAMELVVNRVSAIEGDQLLTEAEVVESVTHNQDGTFDLIIHPKWDGYTTAITEGSVLKGVFNDITQGGGTLKTTWLRVNSVHLTAGRLSCTMYPAEQCPENANFPPQAMMRFARWGHQTDAARQRTIYLSSHEGRIVQLKGVDKPIIGQANYASTFGLPPEFLHGYNLPIHQYNDYLFADGIIVRDIIHFRRNGQIVAEIVDRGQWQAGEMYYHEGYNPATEQYETSDVWHYGCKYRCMANETTAEPSFNETGWAMLEGNPAFEVDFAPTDVLFDPDTFELDLQIVATLYNQDITAHILPTDVQWSRYSEDNQGNPRTNSDAAWTHAHRDSGKAVHLTRSDCNFNSAGVRMLQFIAEVTLRDGSEPIAQATAIFET